jgi:hypothetical protein
MIKVLVVDDHVIVRKGIRALLATEPDIQVIGEAKNGQEAIGESERLQPDVILMDLVMPEMDGIDPVYYGPPAGGADSGIDQFCNRRKGFSGDQGRSVGLPAQRLKP